MNYGNPSHNYTSDVDNNQFDAGRNRPPKKGKGRYNKDHKREIAGRRRQKDWLRQQGEY